MHATGYEGKALRYGEAQTLGCADRCFRNVTESRLQTGEDGILCALDAAAVKEAVGFLIRNPDRRRRTRRRR